MDYGPAVEDKCRGHKNPSFDYPERFGDRVPKTVKITKGAKSSLFAQDDLTVRKGEEYPAWTNRHGAVCAVFPDGKRLGLMPDEFEVIEWLSKHDNAVKETE